MHNLNKLLLLLLPLLQLTHPETPNCKPFGIRLSFGTSMTDPSSDEKLSLRFDTKFACEKSFITVQKGDTSIRKIYCDNFRLGFEGYVGYVHRCSIVDLGEGEQIGYMVFGWTGNISDPQIPYTSQPISYYFPKNSQEFKLVSLADWSYLRQFRTKYKPLDDSFAYLLKTDPKIRGLFINGDIAYDLQSNKGRNYEDFLGMISQVSGSWPVIVNPGNHEHRDQNFYVLSNAFEVYGFGAEGRRVVMLKLPWFNFILFDPYQILYNKEPQNKSYSDFKKQLDLSHQSQTLTILASHYPFRCNGELKDCETKHQQMSQFFSAMFLTNVPLYLGAHFHAYERHYPFKSDGSFIKTSQIQWKFDQPEEERRLISVVEGVGGNDVSIVEEADEIGQFTAAYSYNVTGYGIVKINELRLSYSHYISSNPSTPVDFFEMFLKRYPKKQLRVE